MSGAISMPMTVKMARPSPTSVSSELAKPVAAVLVLLARAHQYRDDDAGEHPAEQQVVDDVGRGVGDVVGVADGVRCRSRR